MKMIALLLAGTLYWYAIARATGTAEPWDADSYWRLWYPISLALSALAGWWLRQRGWAAGAILTGAQLPVMVLNAGTGPLWTVGLLILAVLALPAVIVSALAGGFANGRRG